MRRHERVPLGGGHGDGVTVVVCPACGWALADAADGTWERRVVRGAPAWVWVSARRVGLR